MAADDSGSRGTSDVRYDAFLSYARIDDATLQPGEVGDVSKFHAALQLELQRIWNRQCRIFIDREIQSGQRWRQVLNERLNEVSFMVAMLSPSFFGSKECRAEVDEFVRLQRSRGYEPRLFPVVVHDITYVPSDDFLLEMLDHQMVSYREIKFMTPTAEPFRRFVADLAVEITGSLRGSAPPARASVAELRAQVKELEQEVVKLGRVGSEGEAIRRSLTQAESEVEKLVAELSQVKFGRLTVDHLLSESLAREKRLKDEVAMLRRAGSDREAIQSALIESDLEIARLREDVAAQERQILVQSAELDLARRTGGRARRINYRVKPAVTALSGHSGEVNAVAFSPDGSILASGSDDTTVHLWDAHTGKLLKTLARHTDWVRSVAFPSYGTTVLSGSADKSMNLWDARTGKLLKTLTGLKAGVVTIAFSPNGAAFASGSFDQVVLRDAHTGNPLMTLDGHTDFVSCVDFSPDGFTLASGSGDTTVRIWDTRTGNLLRTLTGHSDSVFSVAFSPDGSVLSSGSDDTEIRIWDAHSGSLLKTLTGHTRGVACIAFSPDGYTMASGSGDSTVRLWDVRTGNLLASLTGHTSTVYSVKFSPDGSIMASGSKDTSVRLWRFS